MTEREKALAALKNADACNDFVWDGVDEDDRPLSRAELSAGVEAARRRRGKGKAPAKASTTVRFDHDVLDAFRAGGPGWQTRMNAALREWLKEHSAAR
ncbi:MAG: BrnA antitoxin family protein [Pseudoxanthomonas sp.]